eukprot:Mrub_00321.p1 GENE.Mrub_00321~~Mrub_00321.p1  ORF type:complete len:1185 (+),score=201.55 Mrub_00321:73-3555(+)
MHEKEPKRAEEFVLKYLKHYIEYDVEKFRKKMQPTENKYDLCHFGLFNLEDQEIACNKPKYEQAKDDQEAFREYLNSQEGCENWYPYTWSQISEFANSFLNNSESIESTNYVLETLSTLEPLIESIKKEFGLTTLDIEYYQSLEYNGNKHKFIDIVKSMRGINNNKLLQADNWDLQEDIDSGLLNDRLEYCKSIRDELHDYLKYIIEIQNGVPAGSFLFAPVKGYDRAYYKMKNDYIPELKKNHDSVMSSLYYLKDLLRGCIIVKNPHEAKQIFNALCNLDGFEVIEVKNGFKDKINKDGTITPFDPTKYADVKIVLRLIDEKYMYNELIEIQIIPQINMELKEIEHKLYDFIRIIEQFLKAVERNKSISKSLVQVKESYNRQAADVISNSDYSELNTVRRLILPYFAYNNTSILTQKEILKYRYAWQEGQHDYMYEQLEILNCLKDVITELKIIINDNEHFEVTYNVILDKITEYHLSLIESKCPCVKKESEDFLIKLHNKGLKFNKKIFTPVNEIKENVVNDINEDNTQIVKLKKIKIHCFYILKTKLFISSDDQSIRIYDLDNGEIINTIYKSEIVTMMKSNYSNKLYTLSKSHVSAYDISSCWNLNNYSNHTDDIECMDISINNESIELLFTGSADCTISAYNIETKKNYMKYFGHESKVTIIIAGKNYYSSLNKIFTCSTDYTINSFDISSGQCLWSFKEHTMSIKCMYLTLDASKLLTGSADTTNKCIDTSSGTLKMTYSDSTDVIKCILSNKAGNRLWSGSFDTAVYLYDIDSGLCIQTYNGHTNTVICMTLNKRENLLFTGSADLTAKMFEVMSGDCIITYSGQTSFIESIYLNPEENVLFTLSKNGCIQYDVKVDKVIPPHEDKIINMVINNELNQIAVGSADGNLKIYELNTNKLVKRMNLEKKIMLMNISYDLEHVLVAYKQSHTDIITYELVNIKSRETKKQIFSNMTVKTLYLNKNASVIYSINFDDKNYYIYSYNLESDLLTKKPVYSQKSRIDCMLLDRDENYIYFNVLTDVFCVNLANLKVVKRYKGHTKGINLMIFDRSESKIVTGSNDSTSRIFDVASGVSLMTYQGMTSHIYSLDLVEDMGILVLGYRDGSIGVFDYETGKLINTNKKHDNRVSGICYDVKNDRVYTASYDKTVKNYILEY